MQKSKLVVGHLMDDQLFVKSVTISKSLDWLKLLETEELVEFFEGLFELITQISSGRENSETLSDFLGYWSEIALEAENYEEDYTENYKSFFESLADSIGAALINSGGNVLANIAEAERELASPWIDIIGEEPEHAAIVPGQPPDHYLAYPIFGLPFSPRIHNCLERENVETVRDLVTKTEEELLGYKNFGMASLDEIKEFLAYIGLSLGMDMDDMDYEEDEDNDGEDAE